MKQLLLMFVILTTSIINAQTFDFGCESDLYSGDRPTELTAEQIAAANGAGTDQEHVDVLNTAKFSNYTVSVSYNSKQVWIADADFNIGTVYTRIDLPSDIQQLRSSLNDAEFQAIFLEVIQAVWDLVNPNTGSTTRTDRLDQLDGLVSQYNLTNPVLVENTELGVSYVTWAYTQNNTDRTFPLSNSVALIEDVTDWDTKIQELEDQINPPVDPAVLRAERIAQITALDNASANVVITIVQVENLGEAFRISGSNIEHDFPTGIFETGVTLFERLGDTQWTEMKLRISNKINEIDNAAELAELRTTRINELEGLGDGSITVVHGTADSSDAFTVDGDVAVGNPQTFLTIDLWR